MKTPDDIAAELNALIHSHYYSEQFELLASLRAYCENLQERELVFYKQIALARLMTDSSIVDIMLCSVVDIPSAGPVLADKLNNESEANQQTRALIQALARHQQPGAYAAVERFLDSDQEQEALASLAEIDFVRTIPFIQGRISHSQYHNVLLQILFNRSKSAGIQTLISDILSAPCRDKPAFHASLAGLLHAKKDPYNPFSADEIRHIIQSVGGD